MKNITNIESILTELKQYDFFNNFYFLDISREEQIKTLLQYYSKELIIDKLQNEYSHVGVGYGTTSEVYFHSWVSSVIRRTKNNWNEILCWMT